MSTIALNSLFEYISSSLTEEELMWLTDELTSLTAKSQKKLKPYTREEINARIDESERQMAAGECSTTDEVFRRLYEKYSKKEAEQLDVAV